MFSAETFQALGAFFMVSIAAFFLIGVLFMVREWMSDHFQTRERKWRMECDIEDLQRRVDALEKGDEDDEVDDEL